MRSRSARARADRCGELGSRGALARAPRRDEARDGAPAGRGPRRRRSAVDGVDRGARRAGRGGAGVTALSQVYEGARVVVLVGPGGVGKTTLAAALAIDAADRGRRVALVTIDPARRLADALGLGGGLDDSLSAIDGAPGLEAAMLDTRASFDALVGRIANGADDRDRILGNRIYRAFR
ncbi:MAG: ATP-binding protein, partial [Deltaproteobacteria bacterium]|nr:ATP-binding protein [Deltaproteobacteria bacterium]